MNLRLKRFTAALLAVLFVFTSMPVDAATLLLPSENEVRMTNAPMAPEEAAPDSEGRSTPSAFEVVQNAINANVSGGEGSGRVRVDVERNTANPVKTGERVSYTLYYNLGQAPLYRFVESDEMLPAYNKYRTVSIKVTPPEGFVLLNQAGAVIGTHENGYEVKLADIDPGSNGRIQLYGRSLKNGLAANGEDLGALTVDAKVTVDVEDKNIQDLDDPQFGVHTMVYTNDKILQTNDSNVIADAAANWSMQKNAVSNEPEEFVKDGETYLRFKFKILFGLEDGGSIKKEASAYTRTGILSLIPGADFSITDIMPEIAMTAQHQANVKPVAASIAISGEATPLDSYDINDTPHDLKATRYRTMDVSGTNHFGVLTEMPAYTEYDAQVTYKKADFELLYGDTAFTEAEKANLFKVTNKAEMTYTKVGSDEATVTKQATIQKKYDLQAAYIRVKQQLRVDGNPQNYEGYLKEVFPGAAFSFYTLKDWDAQTNQPKPDAVPVFTKSFDDVDGGSTLFTTMPLPQGTYMVQQTTAPKGTEPAEEGTVQQVAITSGKTSELTFTNPLPPNQAVLMLTKTDVSGHALIDVGFTLYQNGTPVGEEMKTDSTGTIIRFAAPGTYQLVETTAPEGMIKMPPVEVKLESGKINQTHYGTANALKNLTNKATLTITKYAVEVVKENHVPVGKPASPNVTTYDTLDKFTFKLERSVDGQNFETVNEAITLTGKGQLTINGLERADENGAYYTYRLSENPTTSTVLTVDPYQFVWTYQDNTLKQTEFYNTISSSFKFKKVFRVVGPDGAVVETTPADVVFALYQKTAEGYTLVQDQLKTDDKGVFKTKPLPIRDQSSNKVQYYLKEADQADYTLIRRDGRMTTNADGYYGPLSLGVNAVTDFSASNNDVLENRKKLGAIRIYKTEQGKATKLAGAKFKVFTKEGENKTYLQDQSGTDRVFETLANADLVINDLPFATYYIEEIEAPRGYMLATTVPSAVLSQPLDVKSVQLQNKPLPTLSGQKKQLNPENNQISDAKVAGITFTLYTKADDGSFTPAVDADGAPIVLTTTANGYTNTVKIQDYNTAYYVREGNVPFSFVQQEQGGLKSLVVNGQPAAVMTTAADNANYVGPIDFSKGGNITFVATNLMNSGTIQLNKLDAKQPDKKLEGFEAEISIETEDAAVIDALKKAGFVLKEGKKYVLSAASGASSSSIVKRGLPILDSVGQPLTYSYIETVPPTDYLLPEQNEAQPFSFNITETNGGMFEADLLNVHKAKLSMTKYGFNEYESMIGGVMLLHPLAGATFALYHLGADGKLHFMKKVLSEDATISFDNLYSTDTYYLFEVKPPLGYRAKGKTMLTDAASLDGVEPTDANIGKYYYAKHDFMPDVGYNFEFDVNTSLRNSKPFAQIQLKKYLEINGERKLLNLAKFQLYESEIGQSFDQSIALKDGKYESGMVKQGEFVTGPLDVTKQYWLVETEPAPYTKMGPGDSGRIGPIVFTESDWNKVKTVEAVNYPIEPGGGGIALQALQLKVVKKLDNGNGQLEPMNDIGFTIYLADAQFNRLTKLGSVTTGLDKNAGKDSEGVGYSNGIEITPALLAQYGDAIHQNKNGSYTFNILLVEDRYISLLTTPRNNGIYEHTVTTLPVDLSDLVKQNSDYQDTYFATGDHIIINDPGTRIPVEITKVGYAVGSTEEVKLAGAVIGVYKDKDATKLYKMETTTASGVARFSLMPNTTYWYKEIKSPDGYEMGLTDDNTPIGQIKAQTSKPAQALQFKIRDPKLRELTLVKKDADGGIVNGAVFKITRADNNPIVDANGNELPSTFTTGTDTVLKLPADGTYRISEESVNGQPLTEREKNYFALANGSKTTVTFGKTEAARTVELVNPGPAKLKIIKKDDLNQPMTGVVFTLRWKAFGSNLTTQPGGDFGLLEGKDAPTTVETTGEGIATIDNLVPGWYEITETMPDGYTGVGKYVIALHGKQLGSVTGENTLNVLNKAIRFLQLEKQFERLDSSETLPTEQKFNLYTDATGKTPASPATVTVAIDPATGKGSTKTEIAVGTYYVGEAVADPYRGYIGENGETLVSGMTKVEVKRENNIEHPATLHFVNRSRWSKIELTKQDAKTGTALEGAEFALYYKTASGTPYYYTSADTWSNNEAQRFVWSTNDSGKADMKVLLPKENIHTFYLKELKSPDNYVASSDTDTEVANLPDGAAVQVTVKNDKGVNVQLIKHGMSFGYITADEQHLLQNATFNLYLVAGGKAYLQERKKTGTDGSVLFSSLPKLKDGDSYYALEEIDFQAGYMPTLDDVRIDGAAVAATTVEGHKLFKVATDQEYVTVHAYNAKEGRIVLLKYNYSAPSVAPKGLTFTLTKKDDPSFAAITRTVGDVNTAHYPATLPGGYTKDGTTYRLNGTSYSAADFTWLKPGTYVLTEKQDAVFGKNFYYPKTTTAADPWYKTHEVTVSDDGVLHVVTFANLPIPNLIIPEIKKTVTASNGKAGINSLNNLQMGEQTLTYQLAGFATAEKHFDLPIDSYTVEDALPIFRDTRGNAVTNVVTELRSITVGAARYVPNAVTDTPAQGAIMATIFGINAAGQATRVDSLNVQGAAKTKNLTGAHYVGFRVVYTGVDKAGLDAGFVADPISATYAFKQPSDAAQGLVTTIRNTAKVFATYTLSDKPQNTDARSSTANTPVAAESDMPSASIAKTAVLVDPSGNDQQVGGTHTYKYVTPGDRVKYTITVTNITDATKQLDIVNPTVIDELPSVFEPDIANVTASFTGGNLSQSGGVQTGTVGGKRYVYMNFNGSLKPNESITVTLPGEIKTTAVDFKGNTIDNRAYLISRHRVNFHAANPLGTSFTNHAGDLPEAALSGEIIGETMDYRGIAATVKLPFLVAQQVKIYKLGAADSSGLNEFIGSEGFSLASPGGEMVYRLIVRNGGDQPISFVRVADVMPEIGDKTIGLGDVRASAWQVTLTGVDAPAGATLYTSASSTPDKVSLYDNQISPEWTRGVVSGAKSLLVDFGSKLLNSGESFTITVHAKAPVATTDAELDDFYFLQANNNATMAYDKKQRSVSVSNLVRTTLVPATTSVGDRVWVDANGNGLQDEGEPDYTGSGLGMRLVTYENGTADGAERHDVANGKYSFTNLVTGEPKVGQADSIYDADGNAQQEKLRGAMRRTYHIEAMGIPDGYLPSPAFAGTAGNGAAMNAAANDSNFRKVADGYWTETFYLTKGTGDMRKDLGLVPVRNLTITKHETRYGQQINGAIFTVYGPFFNGLDHVTLSDANKLTTLTTDSTGTAALTSTQNVMLLRTASYVVVETDSGNAYADKTKLTVTGDGIVQAAGFTPAGDVIDGTNYFGLTAGTVDSPGATAVTVQAKNAYAAKGELKIAVKKELLGGTLAADDFTFALTSSDHQGLGTITAKNGADGYAVLTIPYDQDDLAAVDAANPTYHYTIKEVANTTDGMVNDTTTQNISVTIEDADHNGEIIATLNGSFPYTPGDLGMAVVKTFHNKKLGNLTVTKTVTGNANESGKLFTFDITLAGHTGESTYAVRGYKTNSLTFTDGKATVQLAHGGKITVVGILAETDYTVTEQTETANHYTTTATGATGKITAVKPEADGNTAAFINEKNVGSLTVTKKLAGNYPDANAKFPFTIELTNANGSVDGTYAATGVASLVTVTDGKIENLQLKGDESVTIQAIPAGTTYKVTETDAKGHAQNADKASGTITTAGATATFTNTRNAGSLTITKKVTGNLADAAAVFSFHATAALNGETLLDEDFTLKNGGSKTFEHLLENADYTVTETDAKGYQTTVSGSTNATATGKIVVDDTKRDFVNRLVGYGDLVIEKKLADTANGALFGDYANKAYSFTLNFTPVTKFDEEFNANGTFEAVRTDKDGNETTESVTIADNKLTITLKHDEKLTIKQLYQGIAVKTTEEDLTALGYTTTYTNRTVTIGADAVTTTVTNDRQIGKLTFVKKLEGNATHAEKLFCFDVELTNTNGVTDFANKPISGDYTKLSGTQQSGTTYSFTKTAEGHYAGKIWLKGGQSVTIDDIVKGTKVHVTESDDVRKAEDDAALESLSFLGYTVDKQSMTETLGDADLTVTITNTRNTGELELTNTVSGNGVDPSDQFHYTITLKDPDGKPTNRTFNYTGVKNGQPVNGTLTFVDGVAKVTVNGGESLKLSDILTGTNYSVQQDVPERYGYLTTPASYVISGSIGTDLSTAAFDNQRWIGSLTVSKTVGGNRGSKTKLFGFTLTVLNPDGTPNTRPLDYTGTNKKDGTLTFNANGVATFTLHHDQSIVIPDVLRDSTVTLVEDEANTDGYVTDVIGMAQTEKMTINGINASFINIKNEYGSLVITKTLSGNAADDQQKFEFTVALTNEDGTPFDGTMPTEKAGKKKPLTFTQGKATVKLKGGESLIIGPMLTGTTYAVTEKKTNYIMEAKNPQGLIENMDGVYIAAFRNTYNTADLRIEKKLQDGNLDQRTFTFVVRLTENGKPLNGTFETAGNGPSAGKPITFENGKTKLMLRGGDALTIKGIQIDHPVSYTVRETSSSEYTVGYQNAAGDLTKNTAVTVTNILLGNPAGLGLTMNEGDCFN